MNRELDESIATQIFGYTLDYEFADTLGAPCVKELCDQYDEWGILPRYSTDLTDAWTAADHMCDQYGCGIRVERVLQMWEKHGKARYVAFVTGGEISYARFGCTLTADSSESPAHALCLVMLEAVKSVVGESDIED